MKRVDLMLSKDNQNDLLFHLARYKFVSKFLKPTDDVLEIGCGTGYGARFLSNYCHFITAQDTEEEVIKYANENYKKSNINFVTDYNPEEKQYEAIVSLEVIEHMSRKNALTLMQKMSLMLKDNGVAFISTPRKMDKVSENRKKYHIHEYTIDELREDLDDAFERSFIFSQLDTEIGAFTHMCAYNYVAICTV